MVTPPTASCGETISVYVIWIGWHYNDQNHWGVFLDGNVIGRCKSFMSDTDPSKYQMTCSAKIPNSGYSSGVHTITVTGNDYRGYCNPGESGVDAEGSTTIMLTGC